MNIKVEDNFVAHYLDTEFALVGVRTWEIWLWQGRVVNQENLNEADFMETKFPSLPRKISWKARWSAPKTPQRHKYDPLGTQGEVIIQIQSFHQSLLVIRRHKTENKKQIGSRREHAWPSSTSGDSTP
jgi:hypothetical protein